MSVNDEDEALQVAVTDFRVRKRFGKTYTEYELSVEGPGLKWNTFRRL